MNNNMEKNRQKLLQGLIEKLGHTIKSIHSGQSFPFGEFKLSQQQVMILFFVAEKKDGAAVKDLAKLMRVTPGAVTQFIDVLVEKKLVQREADASDRRGINIKLTGTAKKQFNQFRKNYFVAVSQAFKDFNVAEIGQFIELLGKIKTSH